MFKVSRFNHSCNLANNIGMGGKLDKLERKKERILDCHPPLPPCTFPSYTYEFSFQDAR